MTARTARPKSSKPVRMPFKVDRTVTIAAAPDVVFRFFTDSTRWASWWGAGSTAGTKPGDRIYIRHPDGTESSGEVVEVKAPKQFVFTYGFNKGTPFPPGASRVTIKLAPDRAGTRLHLHHDIPNDAAAIEHVQGWRFQLSLFANVVSNEVNANAADAADAWFSAWAEPDGAKCAAILGRIASKDIRFQDRFSNLDGVADLLPHMAAAQHFMPGVRMQRDGALRHVQGMALCDWTMTREGKTLGKGTNAFVFGPTGRIEWVTGFWNG